MYIMAAVGVIILLLIAGAIAYAAGRQSNSNNAATDQSDEVMMEDKSKSDDDSMMEGDKMDSEDKMDEETTSMSAGSYIPYSMASLTDETNVIFFAASWCPTCRSLDQNINSSLSSIPSEVTILKADYDTETSLKQKYGVTYQHTLVQVDKDGNMIKKWSGSNTIEDIKNQLV